MRNHLQNLSFLFSIFLLFSSNTFSQHNANKHFKVLIHEATVELPLEKVWWAWTTNEGVQSFLAVDSEIDFRVGGHYNLALYEKSSQLLKENKILSFIPHKMFSFEFAIPDQFPNIQKENTWVVIELIPRSPKETDVKITHLGWGKGVEWNAAYDYFKQTWLQAVAEMQAVLPNINNPKTTEQTTSSPKTPSDMQQFAYMLSLNDPELARNPDAWTKEQSNIVTVHFNYLKKLTEEGTVIMAGRSPDPEKGFGIVVFQAPSREVAQEIMYSDPAVKNKLMRAEFHDFRVALMQK